MVPNRHLAPSRDRFGMGHQINAKRLFFDIIHRDKSPIKSFLEKNKSGAMHHICIEVKDIFKACEEMKKNGVRVLGDGTPKNGAHNKPVIFLHPKDFFGTLIELEQG